MRVLAFTGSTDPERVLGAFEAGVTGYLLKGGEADELGAVLATARGKRWMSAHVAAMLHGIRPDEDR